MPILYTRFLSMNASPPCPCNVPGPVPAGPCLSYIKHYGEDRPRAPYPRAKLATWSPHEIAWLHADNLASELRGEDPKVLSGWLLRSAPATSAMNISALNTSATANSVLPLGDPGMPAQEALSLSIDWLKERGSTPHILIHTRAHSSELSPASQQVAPLLRGVGYRRISARRIQPPDCKRTPIPHPFGHFDWPRRHTDHGGRGTHRIRDEVGRSLPPGRSPRLAPHWVGSALVTTYQNRSALVVLHTPDRTFRARLVDLLCGP